MLTLPPLPSHIKPLPDADFDRLRRRHPDLWRDPYASCITCKGEKVFISPEGETECDCPSQWLLYCHLRHCGVGLKYQRLTWQDVDSQVPKAVVNAIVEYGENAKAYTSAGLGFILLGKQSGTGKTMLATLLLKSLIAFGHDGYFTQFNEMLDAYTAGWHSAEEREWFVRRVTNAGVLVVDDVGKEYKGKVELAGSIFDTVIRSRVANSRPTIITTNYSMDEMNSGYGGAVMSLLAEACLDHEVTGESFRIRVRERAKSDALNNISRPVALG
jgi:DNA replication protein DnaC